MSNKNSTNQTFFEYFLDFFDNNISEIKENIANLIFYYLFCTSSNKLDFDLVKFYEVFTNLNKDNNAQINLIKIINENDLASIKSFDYNTLVSSFGNDCKIFFYFNKKFI